MKFNTCCKMKPPLRSEKDHDHLGQGLADGTIDCIASDHAPHHPDEMAVEFNAAPFGILGLETTLSLCLDRLVHPGILTLSRLVELLSTGPARILNLPVGTLKVGSPAEVEEVPCESPRRLGMSPETDGTPRRAHGGRGA